MNDFHDHDLGTKLLPAVDLTLWTQIAVAVALVLAACGVGLAIS